MGELEFISGRRGASGEEIVKSTLFCKVHYVLYSDINDLYVRQKEVYFSCSRNLATLLYKYIPTKMLHHSRIVWNSPRTLLYFKRVVL
jgi:hypothetical protein